MKNKNCQAGRKQMQFAERCGVVFSGHGKTEVKCTTSCNVSFTDICVANTFLLMQHFYI